MRSELEIDMEKNLGPASTMALGRPLKDLLFGTGPLEDSFLQAAAAAGAFRFGLFQRMTSTTRRDPSHPSHPLSDQETRAGLPSGSNHQTDRYVEPTVGVGRSLHGRCCPFPTCVIHIFSCQDDDQDASWVPSSPWRSVVGPFLGDVRQQKLTGQRVIEQDASSTGGAGGSPKTLARDVCYLLGDFVHLYWK